VTTPFKLQEMHLHQRATDACFFCQLADEGATTVREVGNNPKSDWMCQSLESCEQCGLVAGQADLLWVNKNLHERKNLRNGWNFLLLGASFATSEQRQ